MEFSTEQKAVIAINMIPYMGSGQFQNIIAFFGSAEKALEAREKELRGIEGITPKLAIEISQARNKIDVDKEIKSAKRIGCSIITCIDEDYPERLKGITDHPPVIYVLGKITKEDFFSVAIVGTRKPTPYGISVANFFAKEFARSKVTCVSGLARGIDTQVHKSAIAEGGRTIAVLGNGLGKHYPPENRELEKEILKNGALISEFPINCSPDKANFPRRNRIISAVSLATVVVEADMKSGSLITAKYSLEQGKEVFAVPGPIFSKYSKGTNNLIKSGALMAELPEDIIEGISPFSKLLSKNNKLKNTENISIEGSCEEKIIDMLENEINGISIDVISEKLNITVQDAASSLLNLELKGIVRSMPGKVYMKIH